MESQGKKSQAMAFDGDLSVGYSGISADQLVIWMAKDTGIFTKNISTLRRFIFPATHRSSKPLGRELSAPVSLAPIAFTCWVASCRSTNG